MKTTQTFRQIIRPTVTSWAPRFADRAMMKTAEGEIRCYGFRGFIQEDGTKSHLFIVLKSKDNGLSFTEEEVPADNPGATSLSPYSGSYITLLALREGPEWNDTAHCPASQLAAAVQMISRPKGVYVFRSVHGPDGPWQSHKVLDDALHIQRLPLPLKNRRRWICPAQLKDKKGFFHPVIIISDDDGESWRTVTLPTPPYFDKVVYPHKGMRWFQPGVEPSIAETASGRLIMLLRSSADVHYMCHSDDGGETWSDFEPSPFFSVATMPGIYALSDGRMLAIWNNTTPLPEIDHRTQRELDDDCKNGVWEDVFTNRDALHAAISNDEGATWRGFREIALNEFRNAADFRTIGGSWYLSDKSVHQNQLIELPDNKVLVHYGQHPACTKIAIFDLKFLEATSRQGNFLFGLDEWSTQLYYRSRYGGCVGFGSGHCAYNRRSGAQLLPPPDGDYHEALLIARHPDDRLVSDREGAVWNFPAARKGVVTLELSIPKGSQGLRISLCDRWINPCDDYVGELAVFSFVLDADGGVNGVKLVGEPARRFTMEVQFSLDDGTALVSAVSEGETTTRMVLHVTQKIKAPFGAPMQLSYLHVQSAATTADIVGGWLYGTSMHES